ncbi:aconitase X swivel domain-containing protein [Pelotomaculum propionicicum]|uniref:aconitase X swivel domain-containing protein n=1 Tax=Pelotomaculum propionicicum TaxID=258475 RepID=UPI003B81BAE6
MTGSNTITFGCHRIAGGRAAGEALFSSDDICFYLVDPATGVVIEKGHALEGRSIAGKVLVFPGGKGSSVVQADGLYQLAARGKAPAAMVIRHPDTVLVASVIIMELPMVDKADPLFYQQAADGDYIEIDADREKIIIKR